MVGANAIMMGAATITLSLVLFVLAFLMNLLFGNEQFLTYFRCVQRLYVDYAMFPSRRDLNLESRKHLFHLSTGFRM